MKKLNTIKCPHCGAKYLAGEIYIPQNFIGRPYEVYKDDKGNILGFEGTDMDTVESYTCDNCGKTFFVEATVTFKTEIAKDVFND